ncbi:MAG: hypothetical protein WD875_13350 [Pirellulales bacterium]
MMMRNAFSKLAFVAAAAVQISASVGCAGVDLAKPLPWQAKKEEPLEEPRRIVAIWNENVLHHTDGRPATRGFGGRLLFYGLNPETPIKTDGKLIVYTYDETEAAQRGEPASATGKPTRKYEFAADKFAAHYGDSTVGHSYNFWVPWDNVAGEKRIVTLSPVLIFAGGKTIHCEPQRCMLEGRTPQIQNVDVQRYDNTPNVQRMVDGAVRAANYEESAYRGAPSNDPRQRAMETTTISIPTSLAMRVRGMTPRSDDARTGRDANADPRSPATYDPAGESPPASGAANSVNTDPPQNGPAAVNSPKMYQPPLRARFGLGQPPAPARQVAPPMSAQPSWAQYRSAQQPHQRVEHVQRPPLNAPGSSISGPSTQW